MKERSSARPWAAAVVTAAALLVFMLLPAIGQSASSGEAAAPRSRALNPDSPCFDNANRYVNCGNGTVTDTHTGLIWLQDAGCLGSLTWADANQAAARLKHGLCGLTDRSRPGDWRLPSNPEWTTMVDAAKNHPLLRCTNPALTDDTGSACFGDGSGSSFLNVTPSGYWSGTTNSQSTGLLPDGTKAGQMFLGNGFLASFFDKSCCPQQVWPVRVR
jgi:hypothetical protein